MTMSKNEMRKIHVQNKRDELYVLITTRKHRESWFYMYNMISHKSLPINRVITSYLSIEN